MGIKSRGKWTKEAVIEEAKKYASKKEWENNSTSSYNAARKGNYIEEASFHMKRPTVHNKKWTKETVIEEAKKFDSKVEWQALSSGSFMAAYRNKWMEESSKHMKSHRSCCRAEKEILDLIRQYYPKSKSTRFENTDLNFSFKRMEIDIYIPELNKGIEFDGTYWHKPETLRIGRPNWKEEEIQKYSETKDLFFKNKGIELMHVDENTWNLCKDDCIRAILMFIGVSNHGSTFR